MHSRSREGGTEGKELGIKGWQEVWGEIPGRMSERMMDWGMNEWVKDSWMGG